MSNAIVPSLAGFDVLARSCRITSNVLEIYYKSVDNPLDSDLIRMFMPTPVHIFSRSSGTAVSVACSLLIKPTSSTSLLSR